MQIRKSTWSKEIVLPIRIFSHNVRYATAEPEENEKPWPVRLPLILSQFLYHTQYLQIESSDDDDDDDDDGPIASDNKTNLPGTGFICLQEVLHSQLIDILAGLNGHKSCTERDQVPSGPFWAHVGVGRDDGKTMGEYSVILYPSQIFTLLHSETVWLSPTPDRPSKGWDAGSIRILTVGVFEHTATGKRVITCCTHLDNAGPISRRKSVDIILQTISKVQEQWAGSKRLRQIPVFLAGDFNSFPTQEAYLKMQHSGQLTDIRSLVEAQRRWGYDKTFTAFGPDQDLEEQGRIDFIWLGPPDEGRVTEEDVEENVNSQMRSSLKAVGYAVLPNVFDAGVYCSDHRCVIGDVQVLLTRP